MNELYYGSIAEREALTNSITNKGVQTNVSDSLTTMAENISEIETLYEISKQSGYLRFDLPATTLNKTITFQYPFKEVPNVSTSMIKTHSNDSSFNGWYTCTVINRTKENFTVKLYNKNITTNIAVLWDATL